MARPEAKLKELKPADLKHQVGARRELVVTVNRRSERRLIAYGDEFLFEKLPVGTRVIYPPPPLDELPDPDQAIRYALLRPENADPLFAQLNPNMRVTIAVDDISLPLPPMRRPDIRDYYLRTLRREAQCAPATNAGAGSGNDRDLPLKSPHLACSFPVAG